MFGCARALMRSIRAVTDCYIDELKIKCTSSKQKAKELSGGNQQKVCLAKAFALEPKFVIPGIGAVGIENSFAVTAGGLEKLTLLDEEIVPLA